MPRNQIAIDNDAGRLQPFELALDDKGIPIYTSHLLPPVHISVYSQSEEARYANLLPGVGSVYAQDDLSGGLGKKVEVHREEPQFDRYYYGEWFDASVRGHAQKGCAVTTLTAPANSGTLTGYFSLSGTPYLVLSRRVASWASDALTAKNDFGAGNAGGGAATFFLNSSEASTESTAPAGTTISRIDSPDVLLAQTIRMNGAGALPLGRVDVKLQRTGTIGGDVRLRVMADLNGRPSMTSLVSASMLAANVPTGALTVETFRFDATDLYVLNTQETFWIVLDVASAAAATYIDWLRDNATSTYARGSAYISSDRGNSWNEIDAVNHADFYFAAYAKTPTTTAFVAVDTATVDSVYTQDGSTYTTNTRVYGNAFTVVGDLLIRSLRSTNTIGAIEFSSDGLNWSEAVGIGDLTIGITALLPLGEALIVCKQDAIYAVDLTVDPVRLLPETFDIQLLYSTGNAVSTNGQGSCSWRGAVYIPFNGRLMAVEGDFSNGFTVHESVGIEALQEWDWPWGQGRHVACAGTRFHLYSVVSATGGYRLLKSANPLRKKADGVPDPEWHGSLATIGDGSQTVQFLAHFDPGGSGSPQLFCTTTSNNVARIQLPRSFNPAADTTYPYDTSTAGDLYFPYANGNYPVHPKAWLTESVTFQKATPNDYTESLYDNLDGESWRRMPLGRLYDTGALPYPRRLESRLLARRVRLVNTLSTASPLLHAFAVSYAMRHVKSSAMREITFTVVAEDGLSASDIGEMLGIGADSTRGQIAAAALGGGTRRMEDPYGRTWNRVLFLDSTEVLNQAGRDTGGRTLVQVSAVAIGS